mgnify:CR=1 FL=1
MEEVNFFLVISSFFSIMAFGIEFFKNEDLKLEIKRLEIELCVAEISKPDNTGDAV